MKRLILVPLLLLAACGAWYGIRYWEDAHGHPRWVRLVFGGLTAALVLLVGPPHPPHPPGLRADGISERGLVWLQAHTMAERLWTTEQLLKARAPGVLVAWLPQARPEQLRRLQVLAGAAQGPVFVCRPQAAAREASAAPLRLLVRHRVRLWLPLHRLPRKRKNPEVVAAFDPGSGTAGARGARDQ